VTPYYASPDGAVTIYHGRWEDGLSAGVFDPKKIALIHADPPYGIGNKNIDRKGKRGLGRDREYVPMVGNETAFDPALLLSLKAPLVAWGANHYADKLPSSAAWLIWDKRDGMGSNDGSDAELAWVSPGGAAGAKTRMFRHLWNGLCRASEKNGRTGPGHAGAHLHPTQKPEALSAWVFAQMGLKAGDTILVPYLGSGPDLRPAIAIGCRVVGFEVEKLYCDTAINARLRAVAEGSDPSAGLPLFAR
jgi:site-specific DNA-methyltransferase (adenine-specific)/modification methylase